jgi:hypothetical protein
MIAGGPVSSDEANSLSAPAEVVVVRSTRPEYGTDPDAFFRRMAADSMKHAYQA